ncbi:MAG TPA: S1 family peptidase [Dermatophilaceae bacterium]|nr:S1 family peptidase [Dermatophilaceae bacterium]
MTANAVDATPRRRRKWVRGLALVCLVAGLLGPGAPVSPWARSTPGHGADGHPGIRAGAVITTRVDAPPVDVVDPAGQAELLSGVAGGTGIVSPTLTCTLGFNARRGRTPVFLTAGHCGAGYPTFRAGGATLGRIQVVAFPGRDFAIGTTRRAMAGPGRVAAGGRQVRVTGSREAPVGARVCKAGGASGWTCGRILARNVTVRYRLSSTRSVLVRGLTKASVCSRRGDSGGPWMWGTQAQGLTSGGVTYVKGRCGSAVGRPDVSYFQPINPVLRADGLRLVTS